MRRQRAANVALGAYGQYLAGNCLVTLKLDKRLGAELDKLTALNAAAMAVFIEMLGLTVAVTLLNLPPSVPMAAIAALGLAILVAGNFGYVLVRDLPSALSATNQRSRRRLLLVSSCINSIVFGAFLLLVVIEIAYA